MQKSRQWFWLLLLPLGFVVGAFFSKRPAEGIQAEHVKYAQEMLGLEFSKAEIDSMLDGLRLQKQQYERNRRQSLDNSLMPALLFNPLPKGFVPNTQQKKLQWGKIEKVSLPQNKEDLAFYSVRQLAALLQSRQITSLELTQFFLERLKKHNPDLYCVITFTEELALAQAREADKQIAAGRYKGLLHGIPYAVKDLLATKKYKTTWGSVPFKEQYIDTDASVVRQLEAAGAVLVAKLSLGELAWGDVWFGGTTRNPWNLQQGSSGSSAGSASAVAAGLVPFAIGSETLGSIVSPSTVCGITGLRPTYGRVSRHGAMALSWTMDKLGPICRNAEDCAIVLSVISAPDPQDPTLIAAAFNYDAAKPLKSIKVGYLKKVFEGNYPFKEQDAATLAQLKALGIELIPVELPTLPDISFILWAEAATAFDELTLQNRDEQLVRQVKQAWPNYFRMARFVPAVEYIKANRLRSQLIEDTHKALKDIDVLVAPIWVGSTLTLTNLTGHPCVVVPNGLSKEQNSSITFVGQLFGEAEMLLVAKAYQEASKIHLQRPAGF